MWIQFLRWAFRAASDTQLLSSLERVQVWAALLVALGVSAEFLAGFIERPIRHRIDDERQSQIASANERASLANARAAEANRAAEEERLARAKIEERLQPRALTDVQISSLGGTLKKELPGAALDIWRFGETPEIVTFASQISAAAMTAGWRVQQWTVIGMGGSWPGLNVLFKDGDEAMRLAAVVFANLLTSLGYEAHVFGTFSADGPLPSLLGPPWPGVNCAPLRLYVGAKP